MGLRRRRRPRVAAEQNASASSLRHLLEEERAVEGRRTDVLFTALAGVWGVDEGVDEGSACTLGSANVKSLTCFFCFSCCQHTTRRAAMPIRRAAFFPAESARG